jgi:hypothetical protein
LHAIFAAEKNWENNTECILKVKINEQLNEKMDRDENTCFTERAT